MRNATIVINQTLIFLFTAVQEKNKVKYIFNNCFITPNNLEKYSQIDLKEIAEAMRKQFIPFWAQVTRIEFSQVTENGYKIVDFISVEEDPH